MARLSIEPAALTYKHVERPIRDYCRPHLQSILHGPWKLPPAALTKVFTDELVRSARFTKALARLQLEEPSFEKALRLIRARATKRREGPPIRGMDHEAAWGNKDVEGALADVQT